MELAVIKNYGHLFVEGVSINLDAATTVIWYDWCSRDTEDEQDRNVQEEDARIVIIFSHPVWDMGLPEGIVVLPKGVSEGQLRNKDGSYTNYLSIVPSLAKEIREALQIPKIKRPASFPVDYEEDEVLPAPAPVTVPGVSESHSDKLPVLSNYQWRKVVKYLKEFSQTSEHNYKRLWGDIFGRDNYSKALDVAYDYARSHPHSQIIAKIAEIESMLPSSKPAGIEDAV